MGECVKFNRFFVIGRDIGTFLRQQEDVFNHGINPVVSVSDRIERIEFSDISLNVWMGLELVAMLFPLTPQVALFAFAEVFFVYCLDRVTDAEKDAVNMPRHAAFMQQHGTLLLAASTLLYAGSLWVAAHHNIATFAFLVGPVSFGMIYSLLDTKTVLLLKNFTVASSFGTIPLLVGSYFHQLLLPELGFLAIFTMAVYIISSTIFDIKDIEGDRQEGVKTLPNTYGIAFTKHFNISIITTASLLLVTLIALGILPISFLTLLIITAYTLAYIPQATPTPDPIYYGLIVDTEFVLLAAALFILDLAALV